MRFDDGNDGVLEICEMSERELTTREGSDQDYCRSEISVGCSRWDEPCIARRRGL